MNKFEDFVNLNPLKSDELYFKIKKINEVLNGPDLTGNEGLGVQLLQKTAPVVRMKEKSGQEYETIMLGSNSYLNLTTHPKVIEGAQRAMNKYGFGMGAVSLYSGITDLHRELETLIADFYGTEDAILFPSGYGRLENFG